MAALPQGVDAAAVRSMVLENYQKKDPCLLEILEKVCVDYALDNQSGLQFISEKITSGLQERNRRKSREENFENFGGRNARSNKNILSGKFENVGNAWKNFEESREFQQMQAIYTYVNYRKLVVDVLHSLKSGDIPTVVDILEKDPVLLSYRDQDGWNLLFHSIAIKNQHAIRWILTQSGTDINHRDTNNLTALHWAAFHGNTSICESLITMNADVSRAVDRMGCTPMHMAAHNGQREVCEWFCRNYPSIVSQQDRDGATPLHYAALNGHTNLLIEMIEFIKGATDGTFDICRLVDCDDANILHYAAVGGNFLTAKRLCQDMGKLSLGRSKNMEEPADSARSTGDTSLYRLLRRVAAEQRRAQSVDGALGCSSNAHDLETAVGKSEGTQRKQFEDSSLKAQKYPSSLKHQAVLGQAEQLQRMSSPQKGRVDSKDMDIFDNGPSGTQLAFSSSVLDAKSGADAGNSVSGLRTTNNKEWVVWAMT